jgi:hypothetical protein
MVAAIVGLGVWRFLRPVLVVAALLVLELIDPAVILLASYIERRTSAKVSPRSAEEKAVRLVAEAIVELGRGARARRSWKPLAS